MSEGRTNGTAQDAKGSQIGKGRGKEAAYGMNRSSQLVMF